MSTDPGAAAPTGQRTDHVVKLLVTGPFNAGKTTLIAAISQTPVVDTDVATTGDLHREDETCTHQPIVDDGEECICLVAIEGKPKIKQTLLKALQPLLGV